MFTPVAALTWENARLVRQRLHWILLTLLGMPLVGAAIGGSPAFTWHGMRDAMTPPIQMINTVVMLMVATTWVGALFGSPARMYAMPVPTALLVRTRMLFGMACTGGLYLMTAATLNLTLQTDWAIWSPALHFAVAFAIQQAFAWTLRGRPNAQGMAVLIVGPAVLYWVTARFGTEGLGRPEHRWENLTMPQLLLLGTVTAISFVVAEWGAGRERRGAPLTFTWRRRDTAGSAELTAVPARPRVFRSAWLAQFWCEWREDGWFVPGVTFGLGAVGLLVHFFYVFHLPTYARQPGAIAEGYAFFFTAILLQAFIPLFAREYTSHGRRTRNQRFGMGPLLPLSDAALAWAALLRGVASAAMAMLGTVLLAALFTLGQLLLWHAEGREGLGQEAIHVAFWTPFAQSPASLVLVLAFGFTATLWTTLGLSYAAVLSGRRWLAAVPMSLPFLFILYIIFRQVVSGDPGDGLGQLLFYAPILATLVAFCAALREGVIGQKTLIAAVLTWVLGFSIVVIVPILVAENWLGEFANTPLRLTTMSSEAMRTTALLLILPLGPFAAAPLAVHYNRHR